MDVVSWFSTTTIISRFYIFCFGLVLRTISLLIKSSNVGSDHFSNSRSLSQYSLILPCSKQFLILRSHPVHSAMTKSKLKISRFLKTRRVERKLKQEESIYNYKQSFAAVTWDRKLKMLFSRQTIDGI